MDNSGIDWTSAGLSLLVGALLVLFLYFLIRDICDGRRQAKEREAESEKEATRVRILREAEEVACLAFANNESAEGWTDMSHFDDMGG